MGVTDRLTASITDIRDRGQRLVQLHRELLATEMKQKGRRFAAAVGLFIAAGLLVLYAIGLALATIVAALDVALPLWASLLIVTVVLFIVIAILVLVGRSQLESAKETPAGRSVEEAKKSAEMFKTHAQETAASVGAKVRRRPAANDSSPRVTVLPPLGDEPAGPAGDAGRVP